MWTETPTRDTARAIRRWFDSGLTPPVRHEATRCLLNAAAAGIGGSRDAEVDLLVAVGAEGPGRGDAPLLGRRPTLPPAAAATVNAFAVTQNDFDDAHVATIVHPGAAALAGVLSTAGAAHATGREWLTAFALGCEVQLALAVALSPSHYERGWHTTSTCAAAGAVVASGLLRGLDHDRLALALDVAMLQVIGLRAAHGTVMKGYQVGRAAAHGVRVVDLIARGAAHEHPGPGPIPVGAGLTDEPRPHVTFPDPDGDDPGAWELSRLTYKPYPAGIVCNSGIEAALTLARRVDVAAIRTVTLRVHPLVVELAGNSRPDDAMQARVSLPHAVAAALVDGAAGMAQFSADRLRDPVVARLRGKVTMVGDPGLPRSTAVLDVGTEREDLTVRVDDPRGGPTRPLTDPELEDKARGLVDGVRPGASPRLIRAVGALAEAPGYDDVVAAVRLDEERR